MKNCMSCTHCHVAPDKIMCDRGLCEVIIIGNDVIATMDKPSCDMRVSYTEEPKKLGRPPKHG